VTGIAVSNADDSGSSDWDRYVETCDAAEVYHQYQWRHILEDAIGCNCYYLKATNDSGSIAGVLPLAHLKSRLFGNFLVSLPYLNYVGLLADDEKTRIGLVDAAMKLADSLDASHIELRHRDRVAMSLPYRDDKVAMLLTLPESEDELWRGFKPKLRSQIRRPGKEGATCKEGGVELLDDFYTVFSRNMRDLGTPVQSKKLFSRICESFPETARLHIVYLSGKAVAAGMTIRFRRSMEIPSASSLREYNQYSVNMLMYWSVLQDGTEDIYDRTDHRDAARGRGSAEPGADDRGDLQGLWYL
jgi:FemAB-related protein (PEP-CTERM system-associated)